MHALPPELYCCSVVSWSDNVCLLIVTGDQMISDQCSTDINSSTYKHHLLQGGPMIIYRMVIVEGRCTKLQLLISYIYNHWLTQKYSVFWLVRYNGLVWSNIAVTFFYHPLYMIIAWPRIKVSNILNLTFKVSEWTLLEMTNKYYNQVRLVIKCKWSDW